MAREAGPVTVAVILWLLIGVAMKGALIWLDPKYRKDFGKTERVTDVIGLRMIRKYPLYEIGWYVAMFALFALYLWWIHP